MPEILIGNVRGPQGEVGPRNLLLATTYQFATSDTADTIPTEWYSETPIVEQGQYCWCKNTMTWEEGEDTNLYSVGYLGRDGEFNGIELVNGLGERITALENRTTPISKGGTEATTLQGAQAKLGITALQEAIDTLKKTMASATQAGLMSAQNFTDLNNLKAAWDSASSAFYLLIPNIEITDNTDLNELTTIGNYFCLADTTASTLKNCPIPNAFTMQVRSGNGSTRYLVQEIKSNQGLYLTRNIDASRHEFGVWKRFQYV